MSDFTVLFGKIALEKGFLTQEQLDECAEVQRKAKESRHLGEICREKGYLHLEDLRDILIEQLLRFQAEIPNAEEKLVDRIFGQIALQKGYVESEALNRALNEQAADDGEGYRRIGEVLVEEGLLTKKQVVDVLEAQNLSILICPTCVTAHNVPNYKPEQRYICKVCSGMLSRPEKMSEYAIRQVLREGEQKGEDEG